eukprot:s129_g43.t1
MARANEDPLAPWCGCGASYFPFLIQMASGSRAAFAGTAAAGVAALFGGASFVSTVSSTGNLRASGSAQKVEAQRATVSGGSQPSVLPSTAAVALCGAALAACGRKATPLNTKSELVALCAFENELGVQAPVGFWDPVGFTSDGDVAAFKRRRSVELKHGRISMMATMGYITPEITGKLPGFLSPSAGLKFADIPNGLAAVSKVPVAGWAQIAAYFGFVEFSGGFDDYKTGTPGTDEQQQRTRVTACRVLRC